MNYYRFFWQQRELERAIDALRQFRDLKEALSLPSTSEIRKLQMLAGRFTLPAPYLSILDEIQKSVNSTRLDQSFRGLARLDFSVTSAFTELLGNLNRMAAELSRPPAEMAAAVQAMVDSLGPPEALLRMGQITPPLLDLSLRPHIAFQEFAAGRVAAAGAAPETFKANTLRVIASASELLAEMTRGPELAYLLGPSPSEIPALPEVNVFSVLDGQLTDVDFDAEHVDFDEAVATAPSGAVVDLGVRIVEMVYNLNVEAEREGRNAIFKPTNRTMFACHVVPSRVAYDERSFSEVVDHLYFLLYEGSGDAKRLLERVSSERLDALWRLKQLRLASRHDLDHGSKGRGDKEVRAGWDRVSLAHR